ncbi:MAG: hypothetical protein AB7D51_14765 [Desulfovibrionaceae bacterium]
MPDVDFIQKPGRKMETRGDALPERPGDTPAAFGQHFRQLFPRDNPLLNKGITYAQHITHLVSLPIRELAMHAFRTVSLCTQP